LAGRASLGSVGACQAPSKGGQGTQVAALVFDDLTALDIVGPIEVLARLPDTEVVVVAAEPYPVHAARGSWAIVPDAVLADVSRPDVLVVPGGPGVSGARRDERVIRWIQAVHQTSRWTTSVCTGSIILAAAGLLAGRRATTHWASKDELRGYGVVVTDDRVTRDGRIVTASGVSAGIDMALELAALIAGDDVAHTIQLLIEYEPEPPFKGGTPSRVPIEILERATRHLAERATEHT
jgi:transcriptional regulator GlxA family with amidase domain